MRGPDVGKSWMLLVAGVVLMGAVLGIYYQDRPYDDGISATGTITDFKFSTDANHRVRYEQNISFTAADNRTVTFWDVEGQGFGQPVIGEKVVVSYRAGNPEQAKVVLPIPADTDWSMVAFFVIAMGLALTGLVGVVGSAIRSLRRRGERTIGSQTR